MWHIQSVETNGEAHGGEIEIDNPNSSRRGHAVPYFLMVFGGFPTHTKLRQVQQNI